MSAEDVCVTYLETLARRPSWRLTGLPPEIDENVLRVLDERGWIEFRVWARVEREYRPLQDYDPALMEARPDKGIGWFSPKQRPHTAGDLHTVLTENEDDPELSPEIRVSEHGRAVMAEAALELRRGPPEAPADAEAPAKKVHPATLAAAILFEEPDISPTDLAERVGVSPGTLYKKTPRWKAVRAFLMARKDKSAPHGSKGRDGNMEAWEGDREMDEDS